jgi:hypothetical protein
MFLAFSSTWNYLRVGHPTRLQKKRALLKQTKDPRDNGMVVILMIAIAGLLLLTIKTTNGHEYRLPTIILQN